MKQPKIFFCIYFLFFVLINNTFGQNVSQFSRAKINLIGRDIRDLSKIGIETDHGFIAKGRHFISDFSKDELLTIVSAGFEYEILIEDVEKYYADPNRESELALYNALVNRSKTCDPTNSDFNYKTPVNYVEGSMGGYFTYQEMLSILDDMHAKYPDLITSKALVDSIKTHEGNQLLYVKISDNASVDEVDEPKVLYTALHHAREPNSLSQMIFYLWYLLENYQTNEMIKTIVDKTQLYFIPCVNPDGYHINQENNPTGGGLWRKNAWKDGAGIVKGVDLNRNYGYFWAYDDQGSSGNPNSQTYRGPSAFSEPETQSIRNFCKSHDFLIALNYHTFGNYLIHPWGFNDQITDEDALFKAMGRVMNRENNFLIGTGTETVSYTVNGDSDDYMYGEDVEKNKIYAMTPEVGSSFWPAKIDIDYLNKSCLWMNISTALLTLNYYDVDEYQGRGYASIQNAKINIKVTRAGLKNGEVTVNLVSKTPGCTIVEPTRFINLAIGRDTIISFNFNVDQNQIFDNGLEFLLSSNVDGLIQEKLIKKSWINENLEVVYFNQCDNLENFESLNWEITDEVSFSAPSCITDSPKTRYLNNTFASISTSAEISLKNASEAFLSFRAKWDIEQGYDYVTVSASRNNEDFVPLCGIFSKLGSNNQAFNTPLYDGKQSDWVHEEISLANFVGSEKIYIKFELFSDQGIEADGFYFDDLLISATYKPSATDQYQYNNVAIVPNIISPGHEINITNKEILPSDVTVKLEALDSKIITTTSLGNDIILPSDLSEGMYFVTFLSKDKILFTKKIAVIRN